MLRLVEILLSIVIPYLIVCIGKWMDEEKIQWKDIKRNVCLTVIISNLVVGIVYFIMRGKFKVYEFLLINAEVAIIYNRIVLKIAKKDIKKVNVLEFLAETSIAVVSYSILTLGQASIHSDTATATLLIESMLKHRSIFPKTWNYANGDIWVVSIWPECILPVLFLKDQSLARAIGSLILVLIAAISVVYHGKKLYKDKSYYLTLPLIFLFMFEAADDLLYQASYTSQILWMMLCTVWFYEWYQSKSKKKNVTLLAILLILLNMGGIRGTAEQTVPLFVAGCILIYFDILKNNKKQWNKNVKQSIYVAGITIIPSVIGLVLYKWLCSWHNVNNTINNQTVFVDSLSTVWNNICLLIQNIFTCFGFTGNATLVSITGIRNFVSITICSIVCVIVPILQARKIKSEKEEIQFFYYFVIVHNLIMGLLAIFFGKIESRYMLTSVIAFTMISARYIYTYWIEQENIKQYVWIGLFTIATLIECAGLYVGGSGWSNVIAEKKELNRILLESGLTKGYATYWNAYENEVYSDLQIKMGAISIKKDLMLPYKWLVDSEIFIPEDMNTFLLLSEEENQMMARNLEDIFGEPLYSFMNKEMYIYVYDHDIIKDIQ